MSGVGDFEKDPYSVPWDQDAIADPLADMRGAIDAIQRDHYRPQVILMSASTKADYEFWIRWAEETKQKLEATPRWHWMMRMALKRYLYGPLYKRYRTRWYLRLREFHRDVTGYYDEKPGDWY